MCFGGGKIETPEVQQLPAQPEEPDVATYGERTAKTAEKNAKNAQGVNSTNKTSGLDMSQGESFIQDNNMLTPLGQTARTKKTNLLGLA